MALTRKLINATFVLGEGAFGESGQNTVELSGLRVTAKVANAGGRSMGTVDASIFGMTLSQMNKLSTLGLVITSQRRNSLTLSAYEEGQPPAVVFQGTITNAWTDLSAPPDVPFRVLAHTGLFDAVKPATAISVRGSADVAGLLSGLAAQMALRFENNGVQAKLANAYYGGSAFTQAQRIVRDAGIEWNACEKGLLAIWPAGRNRAAAEVLISKATGMRGSPTFTPKGIAVQSLFNPSIGLGTKIRLQSDVITPATGSWVVSKLDLDLDSQKPGGSWFMTILATPIGYTVIA